MSIQRFDVGPRMSEMAVHNGTVYLAGQIGLDPQTMEMVAGVGPEPTKNSLPPGGVRYHS